MVTKKITLNELRILVKQIIKEGSENNMIQTAKSFLEFHKAYHEESDKQSKIRSYTDVGKLSNIRSKLLDIMKNSNYDLKSEKKEFTDIVYFFIKDKNSDDFILFGEKKPIYGKNHNILRFNYKFLL